MYRGFNLKLNNNNILYASSGKKINENYSSDVNKILSDYISQDGSLDGSQMQSDWFPEIDAEIFISHSHNNKGMAMGLAGWLWKKFRIKAFVDSNIWGFANSLLREIDNEYCFNEISETYDYQKRNYSTSHVHSMLSTALMKMIDRTECLIFLNTQDSITALNTIDKTNSPWIYLELTISQIIRKREKDSYRDYFEKSLEKTGSITEHIEILHDVNLDHLTEIDENDLRIWESKWDSGSFYKEPLDLLYHQNPIQSII